MCAEHEMQGLYIIKNEHIKFLPLTAKTKSNYTACSKTFFTEKAKELTVFILTYDQYF